MRKREDRVKNRWLCVLILLSILLQPAQASCQVVQPKLDAFTYPNERAFVLDYSVQLDGHIYQLAYMTTGTLNTTGLNFTNLINEKAFLENKITGLLVLQDGLRIVEDDVLIRKILTLFKTAYILYQSPPTGALGNMPDGFADEMRLVTAIFFYKGIFTDKTSATREALRDVLSSRVEISGDAVKLTESFKEAVQAKSTIEDALEQAIQVEKYSNIKKVRENAKILKESFEDWNVDSNLGTIEVSLGKWIEWTNGLELISLAADLLWTTDLLQDRANWLRLYRNTISGAQMLDPEQTAAADVVIYETQDAWNQRRIIITQFVVDHTLELANRYTFDILTKTLANWVWKVKGTRLVGHTVNGAISSVFLGFAIGDLLMGLDQLYDHFTVGVQLDDLRVKFRATREQLQLKAKAQQGLVINASDLQVYQAAYMLEALSASREFTQYADGVYATVSEENPLDWLNPVNWFRGKDWREAVDGLRELGKTAELDAMQTLGSPKMVDFGTEQILRRIAQLKLTFDDASLNFVKTGTTNWFTLNTGFAGKSIWTYNEKSKVLNSGQWNLTGHKAGVYLVEAYIPSGSLPKPLASNAQYQVAHAGSTTRLTGNQLGAANSWLSLGTYYFAGTAGEYIRLTDLTTSTAGSNAVIFDAVRLTPIDSTANLYDYSIVGGIISSVVVAGESATLAFNIQNTGTMPWDPSKVTLLPDAANPVEARQPIRLQQVILPGQSLAWQVKILTTAASSLIQVKYYLSAEGVNQGGPITGYIVVLPEQLKDLQSTFTKKIEDWKRTGEQTIEDLINSLLEQIRREIEKQAVDWISKVLQGCQIPVGFVAVSVFMVELQRRKKRWL